MDKITGSILGVIETPKEPTRENDYPEETHLSESLKMVAEVFSKKDVDVKTDLSEAQIVHFSRAKIYASLFNVPSMNELVDTLAVYSISKGRKSRKEFTEIAKAFNSYGADPELQQRNSLGRLFGGGV